MSDDPIFTFMSLVVKLSATGTHQLRAEEPSFCELLSVHLASLANSLMSFLPLRAMSLHIA